MNPPYEVTKVVNPTPEDCKFKQDLLYRGNRLILKATFLKDVKVQGNQFGNYLVLPENPWLREQLDIIEEFIILNMSAPSLLFDSWKPRDEKDTSYKKIWAGNTLFIPLSHWCTFLRQDDDYLTEIQPNEIDNGMFEVAISIAGVFFGRHKDNKLASITMRVQSVLYKPEMDKLDAIIESAIKQEGGGKLKHVKRRRKTKPF